MRQSRPATKTRSLGAAMRLQRDWLNRPLSERVGGVLTHVWEASTKLQTEQATKVNSFEVSSTFDAYLDAVDRAEERKVTREPVFLPLTWSDTLKAGGLRARGTEPESATTLRARMWLAPQFPLNSRHFAMLLDVMAITSKRARRVVDAIRRYEWHDSFPMKLVVPLPLTLFASITCTDYAPLKGVRDLPNAEWFDLPPDYERRVADTEKVASELFDGLVDGSSSTAFFF